MNTRNKGLWGCWSLGVLLATVGCNGDDASSDIEAPSATTKTILNTQLQIRVGDQVEMISARCISLAKGEPFGNLEPDKNFFDPASRTPDLEIAETYDGALVSVQVQKKSDGQLSSGMASFEQLSGGAEVTIKLDRPEGGQYEYVLWGGACAFE